jgi:hypothetical protein
LLTAQPVTVAGFVQKPVTVTGFSALLSPTLFVLSCGISKKEKKIINPKKLNLIGKIFSYETINL